jgi:predicted unusual protein kinase regulating ubiquinone biosynthesis (AarF/ABC1/UbiB family)
MNTSLKEFSGSFRIPKDYILLGRTISLLLGISFVLRPGENPVKYLAPIFKKYLNEETTSNWLKEAGIIGKNIISLPKIVNEAVLQFQSGNSSLKTPDIWKSAKLLYVLGQQFALLILTGSLFYMAMKNFKGNYNLNLSTLLMFLGTISFLTFLSKWKKGEKLFQN